MEYLAALWAAEVVFVAELNQGALMETGVVAVVVERVGSSVRLSTPAGVDLLAVFDVDDPVPAAGSGL